MSPTETTSSTNEESDSNNNTIALDSMNLEQLHQLQQQEEQRFQSLSHRAAQLGQAAARLVQSQRAIQELSAASSQTTTSSSSSSSTPTPSSSSSSLDVMVPLTESLYVPGKLMTGAKENESFLVELGTGYYVERSATQTCELLQRKQDLVAANRDNVHKVLQATRHNLQAIQTALQGKMVEIRAKQEGARHRMRMEQEEA